MIGLGPISPQGYGTGSTGAAGATGATAPGFDNIMLKPTADGAASTTTSATVFFYFGKAATVSAIYWLPRGSSTQDATNYATILIELYDASNVLVGTVATRSTTPTDGGTIQGGVPYSLGAITNAAGTAGQRLKFTISKPGTGVTLAAAEICVVM